MKPKRRPSPLRYILPAGIAALFAVLVVLLLMAETMDDPAPVATPCVVLEVQAGVQERIDGVMGCLDAAND